MTIEVREMVIRATIQEPTNGAAGGKPDKVDEQDRAGIVAEAVEQVMELLEQQKER
ncbi:MAG: DUF5908 family protein [Candidatus Marinimicrobia bacterium]|nr:DUF5908 family protein [Candidatus Neomarinimicrobiota bacterium]MCF7880867.1 DUF5908 family protein [Candidatus Neomarinimicrobiota bacterium]